MKVTLDVKPWELEPTDTIAGMPAKALVAFAATVKKAGITDDDLRNFIHDTDRISEVLKKEYEQVIEKAVFGMAGTLYEGYNDATTTD